MDQPRISALIELRIRPAMRPKGVVKIVGGKSSHSTKTDKKHQAA
jgi:hypothetical protein